MNNNNIQEKIQEQRAEARVVCDINGATSPECAVAYDTLEELQAEASHQKGLKPKNSLEKYSGRM